MSGRALVAIFAGLLSAGCCGETDECGELRNVCDECGDPQVRKGCTAVVDTGDPDVCEAHVRSYSRVCPSWDFDSDDF